MISFSEAFAKNSENFGINFQAIYREEKILCNIDTDALEDIDPTSRAEPVESQFTSHRAVIEEIAERKILAGEYKNSRLFITKHDL